MQFTVKKQDRLALDRASARVFDGDGHLHVKRTPISKACVNEYLGREIPGWEDLGLDADRRYALLRDPDELAKAADSFNNKPLLFDHNPVSADEHDHTRTVGVVSNPVFEAPYLYADLACWSGPAIRMVEDGSQKELSSAYRYEPDMTPGTFAGVRYDGVMRNIFANHVALVKKGRAGPDVVVGDSALIGQIIMAKTATAGASAVLQGALAVYARSKGIAQDARIDLGPVAAGVTRKNFKSQIPAVVLGFHRAVKGKLAQDADIEDVAEVIEALAEILPPETEAEVKEAVEGAEGGEVTDDADAAEACIEMCRKLSPEDREKVIAGCQAMGGGEQAQDEKDDEKKDKAMDAALIEARIRKATAGMVSKTAMDAALAEQARTFREIEDARRFVRPWVGDLPAMDSEEAIHRAACDVLGIKHTGVHASALPVLIERSAKPGEQPARSARTVTQDSAALAEAQKLFPHMNRLGA